MDAFVRQLQNKIAGDGFRLLQPGKEPVAVGQTQGFDWVMHHGNTLRRIFRRPGMNLGQTYMDGHWHVDGASLPELLRVLIQAFPQRYTATNRPWLKLAARWQSLNRIARSYHNVSHHYDLDEQLFRLFLDKDLHYSCAYYRDADMSLEAAQQAKCEHIANKLLLQPGQNVLDIGCGWGSMALHLAKNRGVRVTGITLSKEQLRVARQRADERGLADRVQFELCDYREHQGRYDRIVSIGMFEHVGHSQFPTFFNKIHDFLHDDGVALLHTIGTFNPPAPTNPWFARHIFPGGHIPSLSELCSAVELSGLQQADIEIWRIHYADTLREWNRRFQQVRKQFVQAMDERFCRMWEFYLQASEASFRWRGLMVIHSQLTKEQTSVPLKRDYLYCD